MSVVSSPILLDKTNTINDIVDLGHPMCGGHDVCLACRLWRQRPPHARIKVISGQIYHTLCTSLAL